MTMDAQIDQITINSNLIISMSSRIKIGMIQGLKIMSTNLTSMNQKTLAEIKETCSACLLVQNIAIGLINEYATMTA